MDRYPSPPSEDGEPCQREREQRVGARVKYARPALAQPGQDAFEDLNMEHQIMRLGDRGRRQQEEARSQDELGSIRSRRERVIS